jgi:hypothetical protein
MKLVLHAGRICHGRPAGDPELRHESSRSDGAKEDRVAEPVALAEHGHTRDIFFGDADVV